MEDMPAKLVRKKVLLACSLGSLASSLDSLASMSDSLVSIADSWESMMDSWVSSSVKLVYIVAAIVANMSSADGTMDS